LKRRHSVTEQEVAFMPRLLWAAYPAFGRV
jgi:hypothetical protein